MTTTNLMQNKPRRIIELVGPAGAGKTTLSRALRQSDGRIAIGDEISLRKKEHLRIFFQNIHALFPMMKSWDGSVRWFTWDEVKATVYLKGWSRLIQQTTSTDAIVLLDHGPIFKLATLYTFGPERLRSQVFQKWWIDTFKQWASLLDMVIWLDAPDSILEKRIHSRNQKHIVKGKSEGEVREFLAQYRLSYEMILTSLTSNGRPTIVRFDTNQTSTQKIVEKILDTYKNETI